MSATQSEPRYSIRTYTGPPLYCAECGRDIKAVTTHVGQSSFAWPHRYFCDTVCLGWYGERWALKHQKAASS